MKVKLLVVLVTFYICQLNIPPVYSQAIVGNYINVLDYGAKNDGKSDNVDAFKKVVDLALTAKKNIYIPAGVYILKSYFPLRNTMLKSLVDCNNIIIFGDGKKTILKTDRADGNDVFQLNSLKNLTISNLSITSNIRDLVNSKHGSNAVSITNGGENILIENLYIYNLPHKAYNNYFDGGKGITIQPGNTTLPTKNITIRNNEIYDSIYGISLDFNNSSNAVPLPVNIVIKDNHVNNCLLGISMGMVSVAPKYQAKNYFITSNFFENCKHAAIFVRMSAFTFSNNTIVYKKLNRNKAMWGNIANWIEKSDKFGGIYVNGSEDGDIDDNVFSLKEIDSRYVSDIYGKNITKAHPLRIMNNKFNSLNSKRNLNIL